MVEDVHEYQPAERLRVDVDEAFCQLVRAHRASLVRQAYNMVHDRVCAEDISQEAFLRAYRVFSTFPPERRTGSWLGTIVRNAAIDELRRRSRNTAGQSLIKPLPDEISPEDAVVQKTEVIAIRDAVKNLKPSYRTSLELYYFEGLRYREIATRLAMPIGTVKTNIARAKRDLRNDSRLLRYLKH